MWRRLTVAFLLGLLAACAPTSTPPTMIPAAHSHFDGIGSLAQAATPEHPLRILIIHGMWTNTDDAFNAFMAGTAARLGLVQVQYPANVPPVDGVVVPNATAVPVPSNQPTGAQALLYDFKFARTASDQPSVIMTYLLWAPLTAKIKNDWLSEEGNPPREQGHPPWQWFSSYAKEFMQQGLGDVVLYGGDYRKNVMRPAVEAALCDFVGGTPSADLTVCTGANDGSTTVVVTHSLGGYMLMDAIDDEITKESAKIAAHKQADFQSPAAKILRNARYAYLLANQLALLDLTTLNAYPYPDATADPDTCPQAPRHHLLDKFSCDWIKVQDGIRGGSPGAPGLQLVGFSDPNDILSYLISRADIGLPPDSAEPRQRYYVNTYLLNGEFDIPYLFSDPYGAHLGYLHNPQVLDLFACGMEAGAVRQPCPPSAR